MQIANDPSLRSFVPVAAESHFPIQNLPFGVFRRPGQESPHVGVAIGDNVLDLAELHDLLNVAPLSPGYFQAQTQLNDFLARGPVAWRAIRDRISVLLRHDEPTLRDNAALRDRALIPQT